MSLVQLTDRPLSVDEHLAAVSRTAAGAVAVFVGQVRDHDPASAGPVVALDYTAHPDGAAVLARLVAAAAARDGVLAVAASHRLGRLAVGEIAVVVAVATAHRSLAFDVCRELVETIKTELPIWKRETLADGRQAWVGLA